MFFLVYGEKFSHFPKIDLFLFRPISVYWVSIWIYRIVTFPTLNVIYSDFLTNWTDTCICFYFIGTLTILIYYSADSSENADFDTNAPWPCYIIQILYELCQGLWQTSTITNSLNCFLISTTSRQK